jgi:DNA mismatch endonuclease (patch repair protein)
MQRDAEINSLLIEKGWKVMRFWEKEIKSNLEGCINQVINYLEMVR